MTPYFEDEWTTLYCCDCLSILDELPKDGAIVSDPPYGIGYIRGNGGKGKHWRRHHVPVVGDNAPFDPLPLLHFSTVLLWGADHYAWRLPEGRWLIWDKLDGLQSYDSFSDVEIAWMSSKGASRIFRYLWKGICRAGEKERRVHPTQKPVALMRWCIEQAKRPKLVIDPYAGSGSTLVAAKQMGVKAIGVEISEAYCKIIVDRLRQEILPFEEPERQVETVRLFE